MVLECVLYPPVFSIYIYLILLSVSLSPPKNADRLFVEKLLLRNNRSGPFRYLVDANEVPDYYDVIKNPMGDVFLLLSV
jgi:hypothetical protein